VTRGWLGVGIADVSRVRKQAEAAGFTETHGVYISETFRDTPAFGKLQPADVIVKVDGQKIETSQELRNKIAVTKPGTELKLGVDRNGKEIEVPIKIGAQPDEVAMNRLGDRSGGAVEASPAAIGVRLSDLTDE